MNAGIYTDLQLREVFHLEFLRWLSRRVKPECYALKGGVNLRFFFKSLRYSEDMDLDVQRMTVEALKEVVMKILKQRSFQENLMPFGILEIVPPDIIKAKQTKITQRFKVHLITESGEDLFTKIEFSRRGFRGKVVVQVILADILRLYRLSPILIPHYDASSAIVQKIEAIATRTIIQPRDILDLYLLIPHCNNEEVKAMKMSRSKMLEAYDNVFKVGFEQFRDTVLSYLSAEDQELYNSASVWDEIRLNVANFIREMNK